MNYPMEILLQKFMLAKSKSKPCFVSFGHYSKAAAFKICLLTSLGYAYIVACSCLVLDGSLPQNNMMMQMFWYCSLKQLIADLMVKDDQQLAYIIIF